MTEGHFNLNEIFGDDYKGTSCSSNKKCPLDLERFWALSNDCWSFWLGLLSSHLLCGIQRLLNKWWNGESAHSLKPRAFPPLAHGFTPPAGCKTNQLRPTQIKQKISFFTLRLYWVSSHNIQHKKHQPYINTVPRQQAIEFSESKFLCGERCWYTNAYRSHSQR